MGVPIRVVDGRNVILITGVVKKVNDRLVIVTRDERSIMAAASAYPHEEGYDIRRGFKLVVYDPTSHVGYYAWAYKTRRGWFILVPDRYIPKTEGSIVHLHVMV